MWHSFAICYAAVHFQDIGEAEEVPAVPAKLLNNTAVLKYRYAAMAGCGMSGVLLDLSVQQVQQRACEHIPSSVV